MSTRREFLSYCGSAVGAAALFAPAALFESLIGLRERPLDSISFAEFSECLGSWFEVLGPSASGASLELIRATPRPPGKPRQLHPGTADAGNEKFVLVFRGSLEEPLDQGIHCLRHRGVGRLAVFFVPVVSRDPAHRYYEAVFNRPRRLPWTELTQAA